MMQNSSCFKLKNKYIWDLWFFKDKEDGWFKYFLESPRTKNPENRHFHSSIGLAKSQDLINWKYEGIILSPNQNKWDDTSIWTGSTFYYNNEYYLFYTSRNSKKPNEQLIGLITSESPDFKNYKRISDKEPLLRIDSNLYETNSYDGMTHFRDPYVFQEGSDFYMVFCSRRKDGEIKARGTVGIATSKNLIDWKILEPLSIPKWFDNTECPYIIKKDGIYYLHFCSNSFSDNFKEQTELDPIPGDYFLVSENLKGPYTKTANGPALFKPQIEKIAYNTQIVSQKNDNFIFFWQKSESELCPIFSHRGPYKIWYNNYGISIEKEEFMK